MYQVLAALIQAETFLCMLLPFFVSEGLGVTFDQRNLGDYAQGKLKVEWVK